MKGNKLCLSKIGTMRVRISRPLMGKINTVTIKREASKWYVIFSCEVAAQALEPTTKIIAFDVGLEHFITTDTGVTVDNPRHLRTTEEQFTNAQRKLAHNRKHSKNYKHARARVAKIHTKIKNQQKDFTHKLSTKLVRQYDIIFFENLNIALVGAFH